MKVILVARKALAAYLISSALSSVGEDHRGFEQIERPVERAEHAAGVLAVGADHDAVGPHEILDRRTLAQEFRVRGDIEAVFRQPVAQNALDAASGADRDGRFGDDHGSLCRALRRTRGQRLGDLGGGGEDIAQIGMAIAAPRRCADRDEHGVGPGDGRLQLGRESQPAGRGVARHQLIEAGLVDRDLAVPQPLDFAGIVVDAGHRDAEFRKTRAGHQADIACPDHRDAHERGLLGFLTVNAGQNEPPLVLFQTLSGAAS